MTDQIANAVTIVDKDGVPISSANPMAITPEFVIAADIQIGAVELQDSVSGVRATVKAASTPPAKTDTAQVVSLRDFAGRDYVTVAASQTEQVLGTTGGAGDDLDELVIVPATTAPGQVLALDGDTSISLFAGGVNSVSSLAPFNVPIFARSVNGPWKITTGADVSVIARGRFA